LFVAISIKSSKDAFAFRYPPPRNHGRIVTHLPPGHGTFRIDRDKYFHQRGVYYRRGPSGFVVGAPIGAVIAALPNGFSMVIVAGAPITITAAFTISKFRPDIWSSNPLRRWSAFSNPL
jgi:hypothetical protein